MALREVHLLVCTHGMWGDPVHLETLAETISGLHITGLASSSGKDNSAEGSDGTGASTSEDGTELNVLVAETNASSHTYDGIDWCGERVIEEIEARISSIEEDGTKKVTRFSMTGYSLGGLVARYVVGSLYAKGFFTSPASSGPSSSSAKPPRGIQPVNFNTLATPHIGLPRYPTFLSRLFATLGPRLLSRTGEQFYGTDNWDGVSLLEAMSKRESPFYKGLCLFPNLTIYANAINDTTVPYSTAAIDPHDPFMVRKTNGLEVALSVDYHPIIQSYYIPESAPVLPPAPKFLTLAYFRSRKMPTLLLPPVFQFRFPFNIVMYLIFPILFPLFLLAVITRLSLDARASRARIAILEADPIRSKSNLLALFQNLEKTVDDAVANLIDRPGETLGDLESPPDSPVVRIGGHVEVEVEGENGESRVTLIGPSTKAKTAVEAPLTSSTMVVDKSTTSGTKRGKEQTIFTEAQLRMAASLNKIPHLRKQLAYIDNVRNSHAVIVARDVKRFPHHNEGRGVLRHWADSFVL